MAEPLESPTVSLTDVKAAEEKVKKLRKDGAPKELVSFTNLNGGGRGWS